MSFIFNNFFYQPLLNALGLANQSKDAAVIASITMDCAKLAGFLVEKRQDVTPLPDLTPAELLHEYRRRTTLTVSDAN